jgi:protein ImuB
VIRVCSARARKLGLWPGQPLAEARALLSKAEFLPADPEADRQALSHLAIDCQRFSPLVGLESGPEPESLLSDVTGCTHLWNGEEMFLKAVEHHFQSQGYRIRLALTGSVGASWALAHAANRTVLPESQEETALSPLPVWLLRIPETCLQNLETLGLTTIAHILKLPRQTLASRFGLILPQKLDQALARLPETFVCERLKDPIVTHREWEVPIEDRFAVAVASRHLLRELLTLVEPRNIGLHECEANLRTETETLKLDLKLVEPTRDLEHLNQLVDLQLERLTWNDGVVAINWSAQRLGRIEQNQEIWFSDDADTKNHRAFLNLVERLSSRLGPAAVLRLQPRPDPQPEHVNHLIPWTTLNSTNNDDVSPNPNASHDPEFPRARPIRLLNIPESIEVTSIFPDGPPIRIHHHRGNHLVTRAWGPERIQTGWWRDEDIERDYYRVERDDGAHLWLFLDLRLGRWFLHGFFD